MTRRSQSTLVIQREGRDALLRETVGHLRDLPRYRQILTTLVRYGYHDVVCGAPSRGHRAADRTSGDGRRRRHRRTAPPVENGLRGSRADLRQARPGAQCSGPDIIPEAYTIELAALRDDVRPFPFDQVEKILTEDYRSPLTEVFLSLDPQPVASASISQVHRAVLRDGRTVALKIRRPEITKIVQADLDILKNLAQLAERRLPFLAPYKPLSLAREFERSLKRELDFTIERRTMQRCRSQFASDPTAHIPYTIDAYSTNRVIAMEFIEGVAVNDLDGYPGLGLDPADVAVTGARILLRQIFEFGFFHADPHPGNLRVLAGGVVAPLDYGMFGQLDSRTGERIADLLAGLIAQDPDRVLRALDALDIRGDQSDPRALRRDVSELVHTYSQLTLDHINLSLLLRELIAFIRTHQLHIPPDLVLLIRSLVTIESVGRQSRPPLRHRPPARTVPPRAGAAPVSSLPAAQPDRRRPSKTCSGSAPCCPICSASRSTRSSAASSTSASTSRASSAWCGN